MVDSEPKTLNQALKQMPMVLPTAAQASITWQDGRYVLEFFHALNAAAQTPDLMLMLDMDAQPQGTYGPRRDRAVMLGPLHPVAGQQRYPIPAAVDVNQYRSVAIWCPELNAVLGYLPVSVDG
ncbi:MAG: DM13 domain-containing protein [Leptolyngbyaceae cyanobacterium]